MIYDDFNYQLLLDGDANLNSGKRGALPRRTRYGSPEAEACGLVPLTELPDLLVPVADFKAVIAECHEKQIFPQYHQKASGNFDAGWNQDGYSFCLRPGTLVRMENGDERPIESITTQDVVVSAEGRPQRVASVMRRWHAGHIGTLRLWGHSHLQATPEHPILTKRGYVPLKDLKPGEDWVALPRYSSETNLWCLTGNHIDTRSYIGRACRTLGIPGKRAVTITRQHVPDIVHLTRDFGRLIGLFLAEGHTSQGCAYWSFALHEWDTLAAETVVLLKSTLGIDARIRRRGQRGSVAQVSATSTECAKLMESLCGHGAGHKRLHPDLCAGPSEFLDGVVTGWIDGDRHRGNHGVSISRHLALNMFDIANSIGRCPIMTRHGKAVNRGGVWHKESWNVGWNPSPRAQLDESATWQRVREVQWSDYEGDVYNLAVENDNSYIAEGVGVHNCWAYGMTAATMDARAVAGLPPVRLSPFSLGWLVGWRDQGYFLDETIRGAKQRGIAPLEYVPEYTLDTSKFKTGWEQAALNYRPLEWFDTDRSKGVVPMIQQCLSILRTGRPLYIAYNWWSHALECVGMSWDESQPNGIIWNIRNSHNEPDLITLAGSKGVPDEAYGVRATSVPESL